MNENDRGSSVSVHPTTTDKLQQLERIYQLGKRAKDIAQSLVDYQEMHERRMASLRANRAEVLAEIEKAVGAAGLVGSPFVAL